jgi:two-component system, NtrC family, response regulator AtoC
LGAIGRGMTTQGAAILLVDPDRASAERLAALLAGSGAQTVSCAKGSEALEILNARAVHVVVTELALPDMSGLELLATLSEGWSGLPVVVMAAGASVTDAVAALKAGAADFVEKPFNAEQISYVVNKALTVVRNRAPHPPPPPSSARAGILGESSAMRQAYATLKRAAQGTATVLVRGESGTGKELVARAIHEASPRAAQPFLKIDCTALPETLLDSELFGYERGAFTGAVARKPGRVELADKGTLFLDEIGELSPPLQAKLLRLLQDRQFERLGGVKPISVDVRVVAATHRDLDAMIERGQFRLDLFYRLNVIPLWLPPLRARREDIELLATAFCGASAKANGKPDILIDPEGMKLLRSQRWPGNVRQLQNFIERLVVLATESVIRADDIKRELAIQIGFKTQTGTAEALVQAQPAAAGPTQFAPTELGAMILPLDHEMRAAEKLALERALVHCKGNRSLAARLLGVSRSTLYAKLQEHGMV